jgi:hypothetical protein
LYCHIEKDEKCTKLYARIAVKNVRFHSNLTEADPYTAETVIVKEDPQEDIRHTTYNPSVPFSSTISFFYHHSRR